MLLSACPAQIPNVKKDSPRMKAPQPRPGILDIDAYVPGDSDVAGAEKIIKLSSNETPLGPSPKAVAAYQEASAHLARYPDGQAQALRTAIASRHGLEAERIVCGAGSDEILNLLANAFLGPGDEAIYTEHGFMVYRIAILANGAAPIVAPEANLTADVDAVLAKVSANTRMVFLANPNNPTGTYLAATEVERLRQGLPDDVVLVLDGAYAEYVDKPDYDDGAKLVAKSHNTVMTRTFSKIYGLAALRIGWAYCPADIADVLNRIRGPFNLTSAAIAAGVAAINDASHMEAAAQYNRKALAGLTAKLTGLGLDVTPSVGNFLLIHFSDTPGKRAPDCDAFLKARGIILRRVDGYGFPNSLRMTIGLEEENSAVIDALDEFLKGMPA